MLRPPPAFSRSRLPQAISTEEKELYPMSAIQNLHSFDPFADARIADDYDKKKLAKAFKKKFACNGTVIEHPKYGEVIQLQGDQRKNIWQFLIEIGLAKDDQLKVHGF
ncbi:Eukaryotic translation initiation factor 1 [Cricetulus griseus]|uniref:Eukaryotic translation initiation factor 1 n=1 Tax=Cricetulus griseus TaxID=10029 RepID=G3HQJ2_CRIGR|nr:Eukaryotic translation initiation factor 1 [Cricetulus griseus]